MRSLPAALWTSLGQSAWWKHMASHLTTPTSTPPLTPQLTNWALEAAAYLTGGWADHKCMREPPPTKLSRRTKELRRSKELTHRNYCCFQPLSLGVVVAHSKELLYLLVIFQVFSTPTLADHFVSWGHPGPLSTCLPGPLQSCAPLFKPLLPSHIIWCFSPVLYPLKTWHSSGRVHSFSIAVITNDHKPSSSQQHVHYLTVL